MTNPLSDHLLELTFLPVAELKPRLERLNLVCEWQEGGVLRIFNPNLNFTTAIYDQLDPVTRAVTLGFACFGPYWPQLTPELLKHVDKRWTSDRKAQEQKDAN